MGPEHPTADRLYLQLWPDWSPSHGRRLARFSALVKVAEGRNIEQSATMDVRMLDSGGTLVDKQATTLEPVGRLVGAAWREIPGRLVALADSVTHVEGVLNGTISERVSRDEVGVTVLLRPVAYDLGLPGEPHLWWSYRNQGAKPVIVTDLLRSTVLWVDERALRPPSAPYNGPSHLPPQRALSGWWSLDDFGLMPRHEPHRFAVDMLGERSEDFTFDWATTA